MADSGYKLTFPDCSFYLCKYTWFAVLKETLKQ